MVKDQNQMSGGTRLTSHHHRSGKLWPAIKLALRLRTWPLYTVSITPQSRDCSSEAGQACVGSGVAKMTFLRPSSFIERDRLSRKLGDVFLVLQTPSGRL